MTPIKIMLADDHRLFRDGLRRLLEMESDIEVIAEAKDGIEALEVISKNRPDVLLFDIHMPRMDGISMMKEIRTAHSGLRCIALTAFDDEDHLMRLSSIGIDGCVLKASGLMELLAAIRSVSHGVKYVDPKVAGTLLSSLKNGENRGDGLSELTSREREVLYWLAQGFNNEELSHKLQLSDKTVKNHISHMLRKLDLSDRTQAVVLAWKVGLAQRPPEAIRWGTKNSQI